MSTPDMIWLNEEWPNCHYDKRQQSSDTEYTRTALLDAELEECCELVVAMGLSTGHGESHVELMKEVLNQVKNMRERK